MITRINETFLSIQGEGTYAGVVMQFIRLHGCNLDCSWCDQPSALANRPGNTFREIDSEEIADICCSQHKDVPVCFTGGEPAFQKAELMASIEAIRALDGSTARLLTMESNGTIFVPSFANDPNTFLSCSPKFQPVRENNQIRAFGDTDLRMWLESDIPMQLKFVVENKDMFLLILCWLDRFIPHGRRSETSLVFQPEWYQRHLFKEVIREASERDRFAHIMSMGFPPPRFQPQSHKLIGVH